MTVKTVLVAFLPYIFQQLNQVFPVVLNRDDFHMLVGSVRVKDVRSEGEYLHLRISQGKVFITSRSEPYPFTS